MQIELVTIGGEILSGMTVNSNAAFIGQKFLEKGYRVNRQTVFPDDAKILHSGLQEALARSELVITTGGLGPTCDDLTRNVAAQLFSSDFCYDEMVAEDLLRRFGVGLVSLKDQATIPRKARALLNSVGTAPGLVFTSEKNTLILLPGVPEEMSVLFVGQVLPFVQKRFPLKEPFVQKKVDLYLLIESSVDPFLRILEKEHPNLQIGIYPNYGYLSVSFTGKSEKEIQPAVDALLKEFGAYHYTAPNGKLEEAVHATLIQRKKTLALAESITGGKAAAQLTALAGASEYFLGSLVVYSNALKVSLLHVLKETLEKEGAVSRKCAEEMLAGLFKVTDADYGIAVTGIAGPTGAAPGKPLGTVWVAMGARGKAPAIETFIANGPREKVLTYTTNRLFANLLAYLDTLS
jgi:nicotinamide-nucleotide amidase